MNRYKKFLFLFFFSFLINIQVVYSNIDSLKQQFSVQKGELQIKTGLEIIDSLVDAPDDQLIFSLSLLNQAEKSVPNSMLLAKVNRSVSDGYFYLDSFNLSISYIQKAIEIAERIVPLDTQFLGGAYNDIGLSYQELGNRIEARFFLTKTIDFLKETQFIYELADAESNLAILGYSEGKYEEAISLFLDVYQIDLKTGDKGRQSTSLNSMGRMYVDWGKYQTGLDYYFKAIALLDTVNEKRTLGIRFNNIGMAYQLMGRYNEAIKWIEKAKNIDETEGPSQRLATRYFNLGNCYMALKDYKQSKFYLEKSEAILDQTEYYSQASKVYASLGQLYMIIGSDDKAGICLLKSKVLAEKGGTLPEKSNCYDQLYQYYKKFKRFGEALQFYELHTEAEDSIFNLKVSKQVEEMEAQYQTKQKEAEISRLEQENELKIKELSFRKRERNWAIAGALLFLIAAGSFFLLFSTVKKQKAKLSEQNIELDRLNKTLNRLFAIISHDLRNATAAYQSSAKVIQHHLEKGQPEKLLPIASDINANAGNLSSMLENLLQWSVMQLKGIKPRKEQLQSKDELGKIVELVRNDAVKKENIINIDSSADHSFYCDRESFSLIVRNLVGNAIKFTSKGEISITTEQTGQKTILTIRDTGCGMSKQMVDRIFRNDKEDIRQGTSGEMGTGLGLMMVKEHVERNGGTISVESEEGKGTTFTVSLPLEHI